MPADGALARAATARCSAGLTERFGFDATGAGHDGPFVVAVVDGAPVAGGGVRALPDGRAEVKRMRVDPAWRGTGLGRRLLDRLEALAAEHGQEAVVLDTKASPTEAIGLDERAGHRRIDRCDDDPDAELFIEKRPTVPDRSTDRALRQESSE